MGSGRNVATEMVAANNCQRPCHGPGKRTTVVYVRGGTGSTGMAHAQPRWASVRPARATACCATYNPGSGKPRTAFPRHAIAPSPLSLALLAPGAPCWAASAPRSCWARAGRFRIFLRLLCYLAGVLSPQRLGRGPPAAAERSCRCCAVPVSPCGCSSALGDWSGSGLPTTPVRALGYCPAGQPGACFVCCGSSSQFLGDQGTPAFSLARVELDLDGGGDNEGAASQPAEPRSHAVLCCP